VQRESTHRRGVLIALVVVLAVVGYGVTAGIALASGRAWSAMLRARELANLERGPEATVVLDAHDRSIFTFYTEQRINVALDQMAPVLVRAVLTAEDRRFYSHRGLDPVRIVGAAAANFRKGRIVQGGSTITQQLARVQELGRERTLTRKLRESFIASVFEQRYTKSEILEAYLNRVYFGNGYYGVEAASRGLFGVPAAAVTPPQAATLAALIRAPVQYSRRPDVLARRRNYVLQRLRKEGAITEEEHRAALTASVVLERRSSPLRHDHDVTQEPGPKMCGMFFREELRRELIDRVGERQLYEGGLRVYATIDPALQLEAERAIHHRIEALNGRARPNRKNKDADRVTLQGSLVAMDARTGHVLALVGGRNFHVSPYNRATQARRQPGSAFKPILFAAALERGFHPSSQINALDVPIATSGREWLPEGHQEAAQYSIRRALQVSSNRAAAQLLQLVGVSSVLDISKRLGIESALPAVPSLALGTGELTLLELTGAYTAFANRGMLARPVLIRRIEDRYGQVIYDATDGSRLALSGATAFLMSSMLSDALDRGTGAAARAMGFRLPAAGKTGTSNEFMDAWFIGYTPRLVTGVWFGYDKPRQIMDEGFAAKIAVPAWAEFMMAATRNDKPIGFDPPADVERVLICRTSGARATEHCRSGVTWAAQWYSDGDAAVTSGVVEDWFPIGSAPSEFCSVHIAGGDLWPTDMPDSRDPLSIIGTTGEPPPPAPAPVEPNPTPQPPPGKRQPTSAPPPEPPPAPPPSPEPEPTPMPPTTPPAPEPSPEPPPTPPVPP